MKVELFATRIDLRPMLTFLCLTALLLMAGDGPAMPPHPEVQADIYRGAVPQPFLKETFYKMLAHLKINAPSIRNTAPVTGTFRALCILVDFSDNTSSANACEFDTLIFNSGPGTVRHYYSEVSYGQIDIVAVDLPSSLGWQRAPQTYSYYVNSNYGTGSYPQNTQKLCEDLVDLVDPVVNFPDYDNNGDGFVDVVMIVHAGPGAEKTGSTSDIWSHKWGISPRYTDGVYISDFTVMPEYWNSPGDMTIGVYCHELGHVFGLPDLYDTEKPPSGTASQGIGRWSLMAGGSWNGYLGDSPAHLDAWCKKEVGWINPINITSNQTGVSIPNSENSAVAYRLWTSGSAGDEYFLVENRQKVGYDSTLPGSGLLIWHIDESVTTDNDHEWYPGHTEYGHYMVALEQADNLYQLEQNTSPGNAGDPYPGSVSNTSFTPTSNPNSNGYSASSSYVSITNISASALTMTADFAVTLSSGNEDLETDVLPQLTLEQNYPNPFNPSTSIRYSVETAGDVEINVYNILGEFVSQIASGYHSPGTYTTRWNGTDSDRRRAPSGVYLYELATDKSNLVRKMLMLK
jgi:immune inhibitor A